jgi:hypothetical protein
MWSNTITPSLTHDGSKGKIAGVGEGNEYKRQVYLSDGRDNDGHQSTQAIKDELARRVSLKSGDHKTYFTMAPTGGRKVSRLAD